MVKILPQQVVFGWIKNWEVGRLSTIRHDDIGNGTFNHNGDGIFNGNGIRIGNDKGNENVAGVGDDVVMGCGRVTVDPGNR